MMRTSLIPFLLLALTACGGPIGNKAVPEPAKPVELSRYLGKWYELARYENSFEKGCEATTAEYSLREDGKIRVLNRCDRDGGRDSAEGKAYTVEGSQNAKLRVSFFGPFYGNYWVLDRADDYGWAIVGEPSGEYLWLLVRNPHIPGLLEDLTRRAEKLGYDVSLLHPVKH